MKTPVAPRGSAQFNLRLPDDLRDRIEVLAKKNGRSMTTEIVTRLLASMEREQAVVLADQTAKAVCKEIGPQLTRILELLEKK